MSAGAIAIEEEQQDQLHKKEYSIFDKKHMKIIFLVLNLYNTKKKKLKIF